jgi:hypothetical protein
MRKLLFIATLILMTLILARAITLADTVKCEPGYFDAGGFCRPEPTGCVYGDSIPLEICDKFKPVENKQQPASTPPVQPEPDVFIEYSGK